MLELTLIHVSKEGLDCIKIGKVWSMEDVVGAAPTGDAPTTYEWSTILLLTKVRLILEDWRYIIFFKTILLNLKITKT